jgi:DNA-binding NarL/FixJ family response regulator
MKKILVIEDEPEMLRNMVTILQMEGFVPLSATNGRVGLEVARRDKPDLILCDVMMPELDGHGVLESLRGAPETVGIPFIYLTARGEKRDVRTGMNLGADDYLTKPVDADELLAAVRARLERHAEKEQAAQAKVEFAPDFSSARPLESLGLTPREAEVLLWLAQGKSNPDIAVILGAAEGTIKKHLEHVFEKLAVESRTAASLTAIEVLGRAGRAGPASPRE